MVAFTASKNPIASTKPSATCEDQIHRRRTYRRLLTGILIVACTVPAIIVVAPLRTRWLTAVGMRHFYALTDASINIGHETRTSPTHQGLSPQAICDELTIQNDDEWQVTFSNPDLTTDLQQFAHENLQHSSTAAFRAATVDLVPGSFDVFEVARRVRRLTEHRTDFGGHDIWECLGAARAKRGFWCHHFARLFASVCTSRGYTTRIVSLSAFGNHFDHAVCEIFLPELGGWMLIDVDFEVAYRSDGKWLTSVELQQIWKSIRDDIPRDRRMEDTPAQSAIRRARIAAEHDLEVVEFGEEESHLRDARFAVSSTGFNLELFEYVFLAVRDDYLSQAYPFGHPYRIGQICFRADGTNHLIEVCPEAHSAAPSTAYAPVGRSTIKVTAVAPDLTLQLRFDTRMPNHQYFQVRHNGGEWQPSMAPQEELWPLTSAANILEVRTFNSQGVCGPITKIEVKANQ